MTAFARCFIVPLDQPDLYCTSLDDLKYFEPLCEDQPRSTVEFLELEKALAKYQPSMLSVRISIRSYSVEITVAAASWTVLRLALYAIQCTRDTMPSAYCICFWHCVFLFESLFADVS